MKNSKVRVLIADDHSVVRMGLASLLGTAKNVEVAGEAVNGEDAVRKALKLRPDIVIMDLVMPKRDGAAATEEILAAAPETKVLILTTFGTSDDIARALRVDAMGAIMKSATNRELLAAVQSVAQGRRFVSAEVEGILANDPPIPELSQRQREILESIARGLTNKEIAAALDISLESVKSHVKVILEKLEASSRTEAATIAQRKNLLRQ
ncbi:MAG: response regulator transcription factor [Kiritimatiellae bacterium]|nr:response regulator transcription factor [Kiritimatiellia bacterium]